MRYLLASIFFFIATSCFAIDQKLVDADEQYFDAELKLPRIKKEIIDTKQKLEDALWKLDWEEDKTDESRLENSIKYYRSEVEEKQNLLNGLIAQQIETEKLLKKLEPLKEEYDRQKELEDKRKERIESIVTTIFILTLIAFFVAIAYSVISHQIKYWRLLKSGKISQEEYDRLTRSSITSTDNNMGVNSATGLPMTGIGISDVGGNVRGSSPIKSSLDYSQDYSSRHRWD